MSLSTVVGTAAAAGCLLALPAFAETAAQGVEEVAKQLASSDSAIGRPLLIAVHNSLALSSTMCIGCLRCRFCRQ